MASPDNTRASDLLTWLAVLIGTYVEAKELGKVYLLRVAYRLGSKHGPEPDLGFLPKEDESTRRRGFIDGPPALAVEIVSPDSVSRDYIQKRAVYEAAGVLEYWILDPDDGRATFLLLKGGKYREVKPRKSLYESRVLPGLKLDVRWLTSDNRPPANQVARKLLSH